jgi:hypothetical protein
MHYRHPPVTYLLLWVVLVVLLRQNPTPSQYIFEILTED